MESVISIPKNIYGVTKIAAEDPANYSTGIGRLPCLVLRTSRFFPEGDDHQETRQFTRMATNIKRIASIAVWILVSAHLLAIEAAPPIGFDRYIISATAPFTPDDLFLTCGVNALWW